MKRYIHARRLLCIAAISGLLLPAMANADINGFGNFSGFSVNQNDSGSPPTIPAPGSIELTNGIGEQRSIFYETPQSIVSPQGVAQFSASFTYQASGSTEYGGGVSLVLQNDSRGASAVGNNNPYAEECGFYGINNSVGLVLDLDGNSTGLFTDGSVGNGEANISPITLGSGDPIDVQLTYSGSTLTESLTDGMKTFPATYFVIPSIASTVGGSSAFVGIAAHGSDGDETISNFQFTSSVPEPASFGLLAMGATTILLRRRSRS